MILRNAPRSFSEKRVFYEGAAFDDRKCILLPIGQFGAFSDGVKIFGRGEKRFLEALVFRESKSDRAGEKTRAF